MTKIVITGAAGFVGLHTVRKLLSLGYSVTAIDIDVSKLEEEFGDNMNCSIHAMNVLDKDLPHLIEKGDKVLHLAAVSKPIPAENGPVDAFKVNVAGTLNVIMSCLERKAERLVFASTGGVYKKDNPVPINEEARRDPSSIYGLTKKIAEDTIFLFNKERNLPYVVLRLAYLYGDGKNHGAIGNFIQRLTHNPPQHPIINGGSQSNDFIYIKDVVTALVLALESPYLNQVYNIGTGKATSIQTVADLCIKACKADVAPEFKPVRPHDLLMYVCDITKAKLLLGFNPEWTVERGIEDMLNCRRDAS